MTLARLRINADSALEFDFVKIVVHVGGCVRRARVSLKETAVCIEKGGHFTMLVAFDLHVLACP